MVLSDNEIWKEIKKNTGRRIVFSPALDPSQVKVTSIDLRVGPRFIKWRFAREGTQRAVHSHLILDNIEGYEGLERAYGEETIVRDGERYVLEPHASVLAWTHEKIAMPPHLAGRIEGRSTLARLGLTIHNTAPTIHPGFGYSRDGRPVGKAICLEVHNANPDATIEITPGSLKCCISQLILEKLTSTPKELYYTKGQFTPPS